MSLSKKDIHKIISDNRGNAEAIGKVVETKNPTAQDMITHYDFMLRFLGIDRIRDRVRQALEHERTQSFLPFLVRLRDILPDGELRTRMLEVHHDYPWEFYTQSPDGVEALFPNVYFQTLLASGINFFEDPNLFKIFQFNNAARLLSSIEGADLRRELLKHLGSTQFEGVQVGQRKEPGFGCGGMDRNFLEAAKRGEGLVRVNRGFLAKHYHTKGADKAVKVTLISRENAQTEGGGMVWKDYIFATSQGQHVPMVEAIAQGQTEVHIDDLIIRPVRPMIGVNSDAVFRAFEAATQ